MIRLLFFGLVIAVGLVLLLAFSSKPSRQQPIDVDPVSASSGKKGSNGSGDPDIIDVDPAED